MPPLPLPECSLPGDRCALITSLRLAIRGYNSIKVGWTEVGDLCTWSCEFADGPKRWDIASQHVLSGGGAPRENVTAARRFHDWLEHFYREAQSGFMINIHFHPQVDSTCWLYAKSGSTPRCAQPSVMFLVCAGVVPQCLPSGDGAQCLPLRMCARGRHLPLPPAQACRTSRFCLSVGCYSYSGTERCAHMDVVLHLEQLESHLTTLKKLVPAFSSSIIKRMR